MAAKHTPGPWMARAYEQGAGHMDCIEVQGSGGTVCRMSSANVRDTADARVIAAAPELLEVVDEAGAALANWHHAIGLAIGEGRGLNQRTTEDLHYNIGLWIDGLRAAVARATAGEG